MPKQETFFDQENGERRVEVLKSYDQKYAREVFKNMDDEAQQRLCDVLKPEETYDLADLPSLEDPEGEDFLWDVLLDEAREDGTLLSFFIVNETVKGRSESLYVSPDWPSAESFAKGRLAGPSREGTS